MTVIPTITVLGASPAFKGIVMKPFLVVKVMELQDGTTVPIPVFPFIPISRRKSLLKVHKGQAWGIQTIDSN